MARNALTQARNPAAARNVASTRTGFTPQTNAVDQSSITPGGNLLFGNNAANSGFAQSFRPAQFNLTGIQFMKKASLGSPTYDVKISIQASVSGSPSGTDLTSNTLTAAQWAALTDGVFSTVSMTTNVIPGQKYWLIFMPVTQGDADNNRRISFDSTNSNPYTPGVLKLWNGSVWGVDNDGYDIDFKTLYTIRKLVA